MNLDTAVEVAMESETVLSPQNANKLGKKRGKKTRKQTRFSIASSPLGTITNVLPGAGSPTKKDPVGNGENTPDQSNDETMADLQLTESSDENEVFFGPMTDYEKRKDGKMRRRTVAFTPNFRANLARTPSKTSVPKSSSDENDSFEHECMEPENPADFTTDSVFNDSVSISQEHTLQSDKPAGASPSKRLMTSSTFYSTSEFPSAADETNDESVYHQALSVSDEISSEANVTSRQVVALSEDEATPVANEPNSIVKNKDVLSTVLKGQNKIVPRLSADSKVDGSFSKAFKDMSSLKEKSAKFLEELRMEQRSRGNTPTNSPIPKKIAKKDNSNAHRERAATVEPTSLKYEDSSSETCSSQEDLTDIDGKGVKSSIDFGEASVSNILKETANRLQREANNTPNAGFGGANLSHQYGTPNSIYSASHNRCNSPLVFSSPKVFPVTVQAQSSRNPMCSVTFSPRTPNLSSTISSAYLSSPVVPHKPSPVVATPNTFTSFGNTMSSMSTATMITESPYRSSHAFSSPAVPYKPSPVVAATSAFRPLNDSKTSDMSASPAVPSGSAFHPVLDSGSPALHSAFKSIPAAKQHNSAFQQLPSTESETPNKENMLDSPNITMRSRKRNAANSTPVAESPQVQVVRPLPVHTPLEGVQQTLSYSPGVLTMASRPALIAVQQGSQLASPHQQPQQMSKLSLLQQKQQELERIRAEKEMLKEKIKEDNVKCFQMRYEIVAALRSNTSPEGLPPMDSHVVIYRPEGTSALTLTDHELDVVTRLHTIKNSHAVARDQTYDSPVAHQRYATGRVRLQWHDDLVTPVDHLSSPRLRRLRAPVTAPSILIKK